VLCHGDKAKINNISSFADAGVGGVCTNQFFTRESSGGHQAKRRKEEKTY
jgi:hypothetical protein